MSTLPLLVVSTGCPSGIGPEVSLVAAAKVKGAVKVLLGDEGTIVATAKLLRLPRSKVQRWDGRAHDPSVIYFAQVGEALREKDRVPGKPTARSGAAQLEYIEAGFALVKSSAHAALVTAPVSKYVIAKSGSALARRFRGHTEWLQELDGAKSSVMCFVGKGLATSLVTTHLPIARVPRAITIRAVAEATIGLATLLRRLGKPKPHLAIASLNPHAGEGELLGREEVRAIIPGIEEARRVLKAKARLIGPLGAETAFRKASVGSFDGVVAMYHDQATIPMKLVAFGDAVNVTTGLSIVRTSVDHGTAYDIAGKACADPNGMRVALELARRIVAG